MSGYDEATFKRRLDAARHQVAKVLDTARNPQHPADIPHSYDDKYLLAELSTRAAIQAQMAALDAALPGFSRHLPSMSEWAKSKTVTLRLGSRTTCSFIRTTERKVEGDTAHVHESTMFGTSVSKTVTKVTEHFWKLVIDWKITAYQGADGDQVELASGSGTHELKTTGPEPVTPKPEKHEHAPIEARIDYLLKTQGSEFSINRSAKTCCTPRRNPDIEAALTFFRQFQPFCARASSWFMSMFGEQQGHKHDLSGISVDGVFQPILAIFAFDDSQPGQVVPEGGRACPALSPGDFSAFLERQKKSIEEKRDTLARVLPGDGSGELITATGATLCSILKHAADQCGQHHGAVDEIERMLRSQLIAAIGKELGPADFAEYMDFHNRRLYLPEYRPRGFCYAVRRPEHYPEGVMSIEQAPHAGSQDGTPINTFTLHRRASEPMKFALSASADLHFYGDRYLHACVLHKFSGQSEASLRLTARARQFSSYILMVGKIGSADTFDPTAALIVQNKDDLNIPLMLETIPTPKEFRDAIESLSPEQQDFAKAFRAMQLASTVFGVLIIQIKPQLERLLNLPDDSLTKEVELTQDLMELFIKYQLPSDLISFSGPPQTPADCKLAKVKEHCAALRRMIDAARQKELKEAEEREKKLLMERLEYQRAQEDRLMIEKQLQRAECIDDLVMQSEALECSAVSFKSKAKKSSSLFGGFFGSKSQAVSQECAPRAAAARPAAAMPAAPAPAPAPTAPQQQQQPEPPREPVATDTVKLEIRGSGGGAASEVGNVDYTAIPNTLDQRFDALDEDSAVRPTIIKPGTSWTKRSQAGLISDVVTSTLHKGEQRTERDRAFDLLDALSRSGSLPVESASLHVVLAASHCFDETLLDTVIQKNVNPIEKAERTGLIMSSTVQGKQPAELIEPQHLARVRGHSEKLFIE